MTIVIGFACKNGIAFAADSQATAGYDKNLDVQKIETFRFGKSPNASEVIAAYAGPEVIGESIIQELRQMARMVIIDHNGADDTLNWIKAAVRAAKKTYLVGIASEDSSASEKNDLFMSSGLEMLFGFYIYGPKYRDATPCFYHIRFSMGEPLPVKGAMAIGSGASSIGYLMRILKLEDLTLTEATVASIYMIHTAKMSDTYCGGETKVNGIPAPQYRLFHAQAIPLSPDRINAAMTSLGKHESRIKESYLKAITRAIKNSKKLN